MNSLDLVDIKEIAARNISLFFSEMIGLEAELIDSGQDKVADGPQIVSNIILSGVCRGDILVTSDISLATKIASIALDSDPDQLSVSDIMDVIGEMNNMIVGNLRSVMSNLGIDCKLCTPSVCSADSRASIADIHTFDSIVYKIDGLPIVTLMKLVPQEDCFLAEVTDPDRSSEDSF